MDLTVCGIPRNLSDLLEAVTVIGETAFALTYMQLQ